MPGLKKCFTATNDDPDIPGLPVFLRQLDFKLQFAFHCVIGKGIGITLFSSEPTIGLINDHAPVKGFWQVLVTKQLQRVFKRGRVNFVWLFLVGHNSVKSALSVCG